MARFVGLGVFIRGMLGVWVCLIEALAAPDDFLK